MSIDRLMQIASDLDPTELAEVIDFAAQIRERHADETGTTLDAVAADPERLARLRSAIEDRWQQSERGEGRPAREVFDEIRRHTQLRREQG